MTCRVITAKDEEFQDFHRQGGGRFSCRYCQTAKLAAKAGRRTTSHATSCSFTFNSPVSGAVIVAGREKKVRARQLYLKLPQMLILEFLHGLD